MKDVIFDGKFCVCGDTIIRSKERTGLILRVRLKKGSGEEERILETLVKDVLMTRSELCSYDNLERRRT